MVSNTLTSEFPICHSKIFQDEKHVDLPSGWDHSGQPISLEIPKCLLELYNRKFASFWKWNELKTVAQWMKIDRFQISQPQYKVTCCRQTDNFMALVNFIIKDIRHTISDETKLHKTVSVCWHPLSSNDSV